MKNVPFLLACAFMAGCAESDTAAVTDTAGSAPSTASPAATLVSFKSGDSATLEVPEMSCAMACYPKVKEALEKIEGVATVELVPQKDDVVINDHRVTVKFDGTVDGAAAIAALSEAGYPESQFK